MSTKYTTTRKNLLHSSEKYFIIRSSILSMIGVPAQRSRNWNVIFSRELYRMSTRSGETGGHGNLVRWQQEGKRQLKLLGTTITCTCTHTAFGLQQYSGKCGTTSRPPSTGNGWFKTSSLPSTVEQLVLFLAFSMPFSFVNRLFVCQKTSIGCGFNR